MPLPKWFVIARNEYLVRTSAFRSIRTYLPFMVVSALAVYVAYISPAIVGSFIGDFAAVILSKAAIALIQILLFTMFLYVVILPVTDALREEQAAQLEIFLKAPVKPSDVLLGQFLGLASLYSIIAVLIAGLFTALLNSLGLDLGQMGITVMILILIFISALWIGTVIAALLRTRLANVARGKDIGRALALIIVLPLVGLMYALLGGGLQQALADPGTSGMVTSILGLFPSSWGAEIIMSFADNPGNIGAAGLEMLTRLGGLVAFFIGSLWLGSKVADRAYSIEPATFAPSRAGPDGVFYKTVKYIGGGGSFGSLLVSVFKDYSRRLENLSWIFYTIAITVMMIVFLSEPVQSSEDPLLMMSEMVIPLLTAFTIGTVSRGKETIFIYKKSPRGIGRFVNARLIQSCLVIVPLAAAMIAIWTILIPQVTLSSLLMNVILASFRAVANIAFLLGLALLIPIFAEESRARAMGMVINLMIIIFVTIGLEIVLGRGPRARPSSIFPNLDPYGTFVFSQLLYTAIILLAGLALLHLGKRKLSGIE